MKFDITFTHRAWFYGLPIYVSLEEGGFTPYPIIPGTGWWIEWVAPLIQQTRDALICYFRIETPEQGQFRLDWFRKLKTPVVRTLDWHPDMVADYQRRNRTG